MGTSVNLLRRSTHLQITQQLFIRIHLQMGSCNLHGGLRSPFCFAFIWKNRSGVAYCSDKEVLLDKVSVRNS